MNAILPHQIFENAEAPQAPFMIQLGNGRSAEVERVIRWLPGKRLVARARLNQQPVLLKVFHDKKGCEAEQRGYKLLAQGAIKTPAQETNEELSANNCIAYRYLDDLVLFKDVWKKAPDERAKQLRDLLALLQHMYQQGVYQKDLHLGNFAYSAGELLALDPASCEKLAQDADIRKNLALLGAQFALDEQAAALESIQQQFPTLAVSGLAAEVTQQWKKRLAAFLKKIYRECTYIKRWKVKAKNSGHIHIRSVRQDCSVEMAAILERIETTPANATHLKRGNSSLVYTVDVNERRIVIKNAKNKNLGRLLRRCWRQSRASKGWYFSHLLSEAGIAVPKPIAMVERKLGPFVMESWFISEYVEAETLLDVWLYETPAPPQIAQVKALFSTMRFLGISHGDMKATNLLLAGEKLLLIDYDGARQHRCKHMAEKQLQKDRERFLRNWPKQDIAALMA